MGEIHGWSEPETRQIVMASMTGKALVHLTNMLPEDRGTLAALMSSFEQRFGVVEHRTTLLAEFQGRRQKANEPYRDVGNDLRVLARKAYPTLNAVQLEDIMKVQFLAALRNPNVRFALGQKICASLAAMIADAEQLARLGSDAYGERQFQTQATATAVRMVTTDALPSPSLVMSAGGLEGGATYGAVDQLVAVVSQLSERQKQVQAEARCWNCKELGHYRFQCEKEPTGQTQGSGQGRSNWRKRNKGKDGDKSTDEKKDSGTTEGQAQAAAKPAGDKKAESATVKAVKQSGNGGKE
jgi:hypothetical protein